MPINGVEVTRTRQAVAALHGGWNFVPLRGEALPPASPAPLQDRPAGPGRHPCAETVPTLPPTNVGLIGAFHEKVEK